MEVFGRAAAALGSVCWGGRREGRGRGGGGGVGISGRMREDAHGAETGDGEFDDQAWT